METEYFLLIKLASTPVNTDVTEIAGEFSSFLLISGTLLYSYLKTTLLKR